LKVLHLNTYDTAGGAAIASKRLHLSMLKLGIKSEMWVNVRKSDEWSIKGPKSDLGKFFALYKSHLVKPLLKLMKADDPILHSLGILPSKWVKKINQSDFDVVNLHWVQGEMLSIKDISLIKKPVVWTLHDMWAFCGAEHYSIGTRWKDGYKKNNRPSTESGLDLNKIIWCRKKTFWQKQVQIVTPSNWLKQCVASSDLMRYWPVATIPNTIGVNWSTIDKQNSRVALNLPLNKKIILFGAIGGVNDSRKGYKLLEEALKTFKAQYNLNDIEIVIFGQSKPRKQLDLPFIINYLGKLHDELSLKMAYSAADLVVIPSMQDNLPNVGVEASMTGTPLVSFNIGGMPDIVRHKHTGYLAKAFDSKALSTGLMWVLKNLIDEKTKENILIDANNKFNYKKVVNKYVELYNDICK
jgi:glycosyltransferase involved in cell wall biosynthesis